MHYLGYDLETGGFDKKRDSVMTAYFAIWDEKWDLLDELDLKLKPDSGEIIAQPGALKVTGLNVEEHLADPETITYTEGRAKLFTMLDKHKIPRKRKSFQALGHNIIKFDNPYCHESGFIPEKDWMKYMHHNDLDSLALVTALKKFGLLPQQVGNLSSLVEHFGLELGQAHTARDDVHMQIIGLMSDF